MRKVLDILLFPLLCGLLIILPFLFPAFFQDLFKSVETVVANINERGFLAPLIFILLQLIQVVIFIIPGEVVQIAGGYLFGTVQGTLFSLAGIALGSLCNWYLGYYLGARFVRAISGAARYNKFHTFIKSTRALRVFFVLFLIPGIPKDVLTYLGGAARVPMGSFLLMALGGRLPALVGSSIIGASAAQQQWGITIALIAAALILFLIGILFREKIWTLLSNLRISRAQDRYVNRPKKRDEFVPDDTHQQPPE